MRLIISSVVIGVVLGGTATGVRAQLLQWTDTGGVVHFTDNPESVPLKYRGKVTVRETIKSSEDRQAPSPGPVRAEVEAGPPGSLFGGKPLSWWQSQYQVLADQRSSAESRLLELREKESAARRERRIYQRTRDRVAVNEAVAQVADQEKVIRDIDANIAALEQDAIRAGLAGNWKQKPAP